MLVVFGESDLAIAFVINVFPAIINVVQKWKRHTRNIPIKWTQNPRKGKNVTHVRFVFNPVVVVVFVLNNYFFQKNSWSLKLTFRLPGSSCIANSIAKGQMDDGEVRKLSLLLL